MQSWASPPSIPTASTVPTLLKVLVVSGNPFVIACTKTGDELTTRTKATNSELSLFFFGVHWNSFLHCFLKILAFLAHVATSYLPVLTNWMQSPWFLKL